MRISGGGKSEGWGRIMHLLCNFLATPFFCCFHIILLQPEVIANFSGAFFCSAKNTKPNHIMWIIVDKEMEMVDLLFKWVIFMIGSFILRNKGLLFLFQECMNVAIVWNLKPILLYCLAHIPSILDLSHFWWSVPVFYMVYRWRIPVVVSSETPIHLVAIFPAYLYPHPLEGAWWGQHILELRIFYVAGVRDNTNLKE